MCECVRVCAHVCVCFAGEKGEFSWNRLNFDCKWHIQMNGS